MVGAGLLFERLAFSLIKINFASTFAPEALEDLTTLAVQIKSGDEQAFEAVFRNNYAGMCTYANKYLSDLEEAEEIVQEVFFNIWNKRDAIEIRGSLVGYLYRAVRNSCINHLKHLKVRNQFALVQEQRIRQGGNHHHDQLETLELQNKIEDCIDRLPVERQKIFKLSRFEQMKYQEIADHLGLSVKTVEAQMGKALKFLRENLADYLPVIFLLLITAVQLFSKLF